MYTLVIVESPAKCKKIESYLGKAYKCIASFGHIRELDIKKGIKCIDIENKYNPLFKQMYSKSKQIANMKEHIQKAHEVILATDDDREGEAIAWHICKVFKLPIQTTKRMIFHEITKPAILSAVQHPTTINMKKVNSQLCRQTIDLLLGFSFTPLLWKHISHDKGNPLSAGRCQTPALRLVYDKEELISKAQPQKEYKVTGDFMVYNNKNDEVKEFPCILQHIFNDVCCETDVSTFLEKEASHQHSVSVIQKKKRIIQPPKPFSTSTLQQSCSNHIGFSPKRTMSAAQKLYEGGYITYMRTDTHKYSDVFVEQGVHYIKQHYGNEYVYSNIQNITIQGETTNEKGKETNISTKSSKKSTHTQDAHEAIRVTNVKVETPKGKNIGPDEIRLYQYIRKHTLQTMMSSCIMKQKLIVVDSSIQNVKYKHTIECYDFIGWHILNKNIEDISTQMSVDYRFCDAVQEDNVAYNRISASVQISQMGSHFSEATLISQLEKRGIGRPSTFSSIIEKIQERGYVQKTNVNGIKVNCNQYTLQPTKSNKEGYEIRIHNEIKEFGNEHNRLVLQPIGKKVIELLLEHKESNTIFDYEYTSNMENTLDIIETGNALREKVCDDFYNTIQTAIQIINERITPNKSIVADNMGVKYTYQVGRYGPILRPCEGDRRKVYPVKPSITLDMLQHGSWSLDTVFQYKDKHSFGLYKGKEIIVKKGKYGWYAEYGEQKITLKNVLRKTATIQDVKNIPLENIYIIIDSQTQTIFKGLNHDNKKIVGTPSMVRFLSPVLSIRKGKYGLYIFYMTDTMKKPKFFPVKGYEGDILNDNDAKVIEWIHTTHM